MLFETFENRRMMSVTALHYHGALQVWGDANNNGISVEKSGTNYVVKEYKNGSYQQIYSAADAQVDKIFVQGFAGMDTITIADSVTDPTEIHGGAGADWIKGGSGQNDVYGHGNAASVPGSDPASDDSAADTLIGGKGYNNLNGQKGNDVLLSQMSAATSDTNYDMLIGGDGNDTMYLNGLGTSTAYALGQNGNDKIVIQSANQKAFIYGGDGHDTVDYGEFGQAVYVKPDGATYSGPRTDAAARKQRVMTDVEVVSATNFGDYLSGSEGNNTFIALGGNDKVYGNGGADIILGGVGNDEMYGGTGNDTIAGDAGLDTISGEANSDYLFGGADNDQIWGGGGNDNVYGDAGSDHLYGGVGNDTIVGGAGADYLESKDGSVMNDILYGDNKDGSGNLGVLDVAYIDRGGAPFFFSDATIGLESVAS